MKKVKIKYNNVFLTLLIIIFLITLITSICNIIKWKLDSKKTDNQIIKLQEITKIEETNDTDNTEIVEPVEDDKFNPYWDYIKMNLIDVNFNNLKSINNQTKAWVVVNGTNINYPVVQTNNNKYYLAHSFDKSYNDAGWVFLDYRNKLNGNDKNTIIYAHGRLDNTMFGSLRNILTNGWLDDSNNFIIKLSTEYENTLWQVFSTYRIPNTSDYIKTDFSNKDEFVEFANMLIDRSMYDFNTTISENDRILTLSTCYDNYDKIAIHAKLIKREVK